MMKDEIEEKNQSKKILRNKTNNNPKNNEQIELKKTKMIHYILARRIEKRLRRKRKKYIGTKPIHHRVHSSKHLKNND